MTIALAQVGNATAAAANIYVSTGNTAITSLTMCNWGPNPTYANLFVVPNGNAASTLNIALSNVLITSGETAQLYMFAEKLLLGPNDTIRANVSNVTVTAITSYTSL
jgi:hypothetical protein